MSLTRGDYINIGAGLLNGFTNGRTWSCFEKYGENAPISTDPGAFYSCLPNPGVALLASALGFYALWLDWNNQGIIIRWFIIGGVATAAGTVAGASV